MKSLWVAILPLIGIVAIVFFVKESPWIAVENTIPLPSSWDAQSRRFG